MTDLSELDEIEVVDLEEYSCSGMPIPLRVKYYLIRVDDEKIRVRSPITAKEILIAADLAPDDYRLKQRFKNGKTHELELNQSVDLRTSGVEKFDSILSSATQIIVNGREKLVTDKHLTFIELIHLAFDTPPQGSNMCFTVTYRNGPKKRPEGTIVDGDSIRVKRGMIFNVTATDKS